MPLEEVGAELNRVANRQRADGRGLWNMTRARVKRRRLPSSETILGYRVQRAVGIEAQQMPERVFEKQFDDRIRVHDFKS